MTDSLIHNLGMRDTEYAALAAKGYNPELEHQLIEAGENLFQAFKLTRLLGVLQDKPPDTEAEWEEVMNAIKNVCREKT